ncbi:uncharacterized protein B0I36DRAFT_362186 [Microdochium trichocladiopsis]|uniref:Uncharacterized protein n=1 Tax=Microdochium trichocladiopsis TaxID=1682393 RepID=A0A9P8Y999_9PEZI|nr:uncharacterized protein B0I36DRAFT_362186 [Microdochium trichocladiopsis]KAH7033529.1 hypothetical protein B0I36DRAFT_362186 [Microdochium trichocladiopsis]
MLTSRDRPTPPPKVRRSDVYYVLYIGGLHLLFTCANMAVCQLHKPFSSDTAHQEYYVLLYLSSLVIEITSGFLLLDSLGDFDKRLTASCVFALAGAGTALTLSLVREYPRFEDFAAIVSSLGVKFWVLYVLDLSLGIEEKLVDWASAFAERKLYPANSSQASDRKGL